jgi:hypothetical protein
MLLEATAMEALVASPVVAAAGVEALEAPEALMVELELSGPVLLVNSHQQTQETFNGTLYTNQKRPTCRASYPW